MRLLFCLGYCSVSICLEAKLLKGTSIVGDLLCSLVRAWNMNYQSDWA